MRNGMLFLSMLLASLALLWCAAAAAPRPEGVLRLHIVAHSDAPEDQRVKLLVRDAVLQAEREALAAAGSRAGAEQRVMADAADILAAADEVLSENGCGYSARLALGSYAFPRRVYAQRAYPAGDYAAVRLVLGAGAGQNWWCVLFPPLCIMEDESGDIEYEENGGLKWKSLLKETREKRRERNQAEAAECAASQRSLDP